MPDGKEKLRRRSQRRQPFTASALVLEPKSDTLLRARIADLGADGCFVDTLNPFAPGTRVKIRIEKSGATFEALARVVYSLTSMGMGLAFCSAGPEQLWVLHEWLGDTSNALTPDSTLPTGEGEDSPNADSPVKDRSKDIHCEALGRLIAELMDQGLLSEAKGNAILETLSCCSEK
jgi:PilZ domain-containing protein